MTTPSTPQIIESTKAEDTERFGTKLAEFLQPGMVLALYGDLGAGKTALARGVARGLGITEPVTSPTFTVVQEYRGRGAVWLYHLDMYRISNEEDAIAFGVDEYLFAPEGITLIEWPERIEDLLHMGGRKNTGLLSIYIEHKGLQEREIRVQSSALVAG